MTPTTVARPRHFLSVTDLDAVDLERCLELALRLKAERALGADAPTAQALAGRYVAMLFEKPSLRTRTTFEIAVRELGGEVLALQPDVALGRREPIADVARNLERWVHAVVIRTFSQRALEEFAAATTRLHVINALTDEQHPCRRSPISLRSRNASDRSQAGRWRSSATATTSPLRSRMRPRCLV